MAINFTKQKNGPIIASQTERDTRAAILIPPRPFLFGIFSIYYSVGIRRRTYG